MNKIRKITKLDKKVEGIEAKETATEKMSTQVKTKDPHASVLIVPTSLKYETPSDVEFFRDLRVVLEEAYLNNASFFEALDSIGENLGFPNGPKEAYKNENRKFLDWQMRSEFHGA